MAVLLGAAACGGLATEDSRIAACDAESRSPDACAASASRCAQVYRDGQLLRGCPSSVCRPVCVDASDCAAGEECVLREGEHGELCSGILYDTNYPKHVCEHATP
jgi:hypothetical protein